MDDLPIETASGNVFADLGVSEPEDMLLRSSLVIELRRLMEFRELTQTATAKLLDIDQADLSKLLGGQLRRYTAERLLRMLTVLDQDIEIVLRPRAGGGGGRITVHPAAT